MSGLCTWWWEHATSSRSLRTCRFYLTKTAPSVSQRLWGIRAWHISPDSSICNSDTDLVDNKGFCVRPSLCQQSFSCISYTQAVWRRPSPKHHKRTVGQQSIFRGVFALSKGIQPPSVCMLESEWKLLCLLCFSIYFLWKEWLWSAGEFHFVGLMWSKQIFLIDVLFLALWSFSNNQSQSM